MAQAVKSVFLEIVQRSSDEVPQATLCLLFKLPLQVNLLCSWSLERCGVFSAGDP
jgi:hypothetical protein